MTNEIASRYGQGFIDLAIETGTVEEKREEAALLLQVVTENPDVILFLEAVKVTDEEKKKFIDDVFGKSMSVDTIHLFKLLIDRRRIYELKDILNAIEDLACQELGIEKAVVSSARPLAEEDMNRIQAALEKQTGKTVQLTNHVDPTLIAGIKVTMNNRVTDITMKRKIDVMKDSLLKGGQVS